MSSSNSTKQYLPTPLPALPSTTLRTLCRVLLLQNVSTISPSSTSLSNPSSTESPFTRVNSIVKKIVNVTANKATILQELSKVARELGQTSITEMDSVLHELEDAVRKISLSSTPTANTTSTTTKGHKRNSEGGYIEAVSSQPLPPPSPPFPPPAPSNHLPASVMTISDDSSEIKLLRVLQTLQTLGKAEEKKLDKKNKSEPTNSNSNTSINASTTHGESSYTEAAEALPVDPTVDPTPDPTPNPNPTPNPTKEVSERSGAERSGPKRSGAWCGLFCVQGWVVLDRP